MCIYTTFSFYLFVISDWVGCTSCAKTKLQWRCYASYDVFAINKSILGKTISADRGGDKCFKETLEKDGYEKSNIYKTGLYWKKGLQNHQCLS